MKKNKLFWIAIIILLICLPLCFGAYEDVIGIYNVIRGGTGNQTLTDHGVLLGSGTDPVTVTTAGSDGQSLIANGSNSDPGWEYLPRQNLLTNTQWIACSNADTAKGLGEIEYDNPNSISPTVGEVFTGGTSGATGVLIESDSNTLILGRCAGRFHDNERIRGGTSGFGADINLPNSAAGADKLVQNGEFSVDTDPPPGWTAGNSATLTTEAGGKISNCLMITENGGADPSAYQAISVTAGKNYYLKGFVKAGTEATYYIKIYDQSNASIIYITDNIEETAGDWSTSFTRYFKAPVGCSDITIYLIQICDAAAGTTIYFDEVSCYEVTPGCTGGNNLTFDGWYKDLTLDVYRQHNDSTYTKNGSFYSLKCVPSAAEDYFGYPVGRSSLKEFCLQYRDKTVAFACYAYTSTADHFKIGIYDGSYTYSSYHTGGSSFEWIELTDTISNSASDIAFVFRFDQSSGIVYISQPMLVFGSSIGQGNYVPESNKRIYFEKKIDSQSFDNKTGANGFSDIAATEMILESDSLACIGKSVKVVRVSMQANDSGSAGTDCEFYAGSDSSDLGAEFSCSPAGKTNDYRERIVGWIPCNESSNYEYYINASGSTTFDIPQFHYIGIEWR